MKHWIPLWPKSRFVVKNTKPDCNCQFRSIATSIGIGHRTLRKLVSYYILKIPDQEFSHILNIYHLEKKYGEFKGRWNPDNIKNKADLASEVIKPGFNFEGDDVTLSILSKILELDFIILTMRNSCKYINKIEGPGNKFFVVLNYISVGNSGHYKTIGFKLKSTIKSVFDNKVSHTVEKILDRSKIV